MSDDSRRGEKGLRPIADVLGEVLRASGLADDVARARAMEHWPAAVGPQIAGVTQPRLLAEDGTLVVGVRTHGWMQELTLMERALVAKMNAAAGGEAVRRIRWELMR